MWDGVGGLGRRAVGKFKFRAMDPQVQSCGQIAVARKRVTSFIFATAFGKTQHMGSTRDWHNVCS